jgi:DNA-binding Lrp family transcriptional regulator
MDGERGNKEELEGKILGLLSMNSRLGIDKLAEQTGISRNQAYDLLKRIVKKHEIRFVPEIGIENLWKYEFLGLSWGKSKRELQDTMLKEDATQLGFGEYMAMIEFKGMEEPTNEEILKATEGSYMPQYIARMSGQCSLFMYLIARSPAEASKFIYRFKNNLNKYNFSMKLQFIFPSFGYFPLNDKFIEQTQIQHRYKKLLLALNKNARIRLSSLSGEFGGVSNMTMSTMNARLKELGLVKRTTICMQNPNGQLAKLFIVSIIDEKKFVKSTDQLFMNIVKNSAKHYIFIANIKNPYGFMFIAKFSSMLEAERFRKELEMLDMGVEIGESTVLENVSGNLGIRNFAPEATVQYAWLKTKGLVSAKEPSDGIAVTSHGVRVDSISRKTPYRKSFIPTS